MGRNSKKDAAMVEARDTTLKLMRDVAESARVAVDEFAQDPRWCGVPGPDAGSSAGSCPYPFNRSLSRYVDESTKEPEKKDKHGWSYHPTDRLRMPRDAAEGAEFHTQQIWALSRMFEAGIPDWEYAKGPDGTYNRNLEQVVRDESPAAFMDRIRGKLRYAERLDEPDGLVVRTFALLECVPKGRPVEDTGVKVTKAGVLPKMQMYEYRINSKVVSTLPPMLGQVVVGVRAVFDHVALALLPKTLKDHEKKFLEWIHERGDEARGVDVIKFLSDNHLPSGGQDPAAPYLRKFCDKQGKAGTRKPWRVRPEALTLIGVRP